MRPSILGLTAFLLLAVAGGLYGYRTFLQPSRLAACDAAIQVRLLAPSTYRRIKAAEADPAETADHDYHAYVEYEASNAAGVPIRSFTDCSMDAKGEIPSAELAPHLVKIDGLTKSGWLLEQAKQLSGQ